jgi:CheY-like chemotaxis protein
VYDTILCDLNLESESGQSVSGFDLHRQICENLEARAELRPHFIFMTGDLVDSPISEQASSDGNRVLQKPFRIADLLQLLGERPSTADVLQPKDSSS